MGNIRVFAATLACVFSGAAVADNSCPPGGDSDKPNLVAQDKLKNRLTTPGAPTPDVTLSVLLAPGDDLHRWNHNKAARISGYVSDVKVGGVESANCHAEDARHRDVHIYLSKDAQHAAKSESVIVEITPGMRDKLNHNADWTTAAIKDKFLHKTVTVTGWLFDDVEHKAAATNTYPKGEHNWRATIWEIHPVTDIELAAGEKKRRSS